MVGFAVSRARRQKSSFGGLCSPPGSSAQGERGKPQGEALRRIRRTPERSWHLARALPPGPPAAVWGCGDSRRPAGEDVMGAFVAADTHFGRCAVLRCGSRPFGSAAEMDEAFAGKRRACAGPKDRLSPSPPCRAHGGLEGQAGRRKTLESQSAGSAGKGASPAGTRDSGVFSSSPPMALDQLRRRLHLRPCPDAGRRLHSSFPAGAQPEKYILFLWSLFFPLDFFRKILQT